MADGIRGAVLKSRRARRLAALLAALLAAAPPPGRADPANEPPILGSVEALRDFLIQDVCVDGAGRILVGIAPLDATGCPAHRDLRVGERLPYHKHDHPSPDQAAGAPLGYQRHDSVPVETAGLGIVVEHSFDFGVGENRRFGVFDRGSDGGDIAVLSGGAASFGITEDGGAGFQLFVGECSGPVDAAALRHSWILAEFDPAHPALLAGTTIARLNDLTAGHQDQCPARFNASYTTWRVVPFRYRAAPGQGAPVALTTLISEHYGGGDPATADHVERFYFTRELGGTRWERWQNAAGNRQFSAAKIAARAAWFASTGRCSSAEPPTGARMLLIDCREWTRIEPPHDPAGDHPGFFVEAIRARPDAPPFLAAPPK